MLSGTPTPILKPDSDWQASAQSLIDGIAALPTPNRRIDLLESLCEQLGNELYPAFLQLLYEVEVTGDAEAKHMIASTLVDCLLSGRLPAGQSSNWGSLNRGPDSGTSSIYLGPIEYICAWQGQGRTDQKKLSVTQFNDILSSLIRLISNHQKAKELYAKKLISDANDAVSGAFSRATRSGLEAVAKALISGHSEAGIAQLFLDAAAPRSSLSQIARSSSDFL